MRLSGSGMGIALGSASIATLAAVSVLAGAGGRKQPAKVNPDAELVNEFQKRVAQYVQLRKTSAAQLPSLKPTDAPEKINEYQRALAGAIQAARPGAKQGDIFTPAIAAEIRRLVKIAMRGARANQIRSSLKGGEPVNLRLAVNGQYPSKAPLETTPSTLLGNLPNLPPEVEYRVVGRSLVLRDVNANLIVDFVPRALP